MAASGIEWQSVAFDSILIGGHSAHQVHWEDIKKAMDTDKSKSREINRKIAEATLESLEKGFYRKQKLIDISKLMAFCKANSVLYVQEEELELDFQPLVGVTTTFTVFQCTTLQSAEKLALACPAPQDSKIGVLNFASARNPGGGFLKGANAQEESLARSSGLYPCLIKHQQFYRDNGMEKSRNYTDHIIYSPKVPVIKDDSGKPLDLPYCVNFISSPAPNATAGDRKSTEFLESIFTQRATRILTIAAGNGNTKLVLGAWGCGVFGNEPKSIAMIFKTLLQNQFKDCFELVEFAILDAEMAKLFAEVFETDVQIIASHNTRLIKKK